MASQLSQNENIYNLIETKKEGIDFYHTCYWFEEQFVKAFNDASKEFLSIDTKVCLLALSHKSIDLWKGNDYLVTQFEIIKDCFVYLRTSNTTVQLVLDNTLGERPELKGALKLKHISELEAKIISSFNDFLFKSLKGVFQSKRRITRLQATLTSEPKFIHVTFGIFIPPHRDFIGKIVVSIPDFILHKPDPIPPPEEPIDIFSIDYVRILADITAGKTKISLQDMENIEPDDIVVLERSRSDRLFLKTPAGDKIPFKIKPDPKMILDTSEMYGGDDPLTQPDIPEKNKWDSLQVDVTAEFEKVKVSLGEIKQITEGLVLDIAPIAENEIHLYAGDESIAIGELIIIDDKFAVKISKVFSNNNKTKPVKPVDEFNLEDDELYPPPRKRYHEEELEQEKKAKKRNRKQSQEQYDDEGWDEEQGGSTDQGQERMTPEHAQHIMNQLVQQGMPAEQAQAILEHLLQQGVTLDQAYHSINQMLQGQAGGQAPQQQGPPPQQGQGNQDDFDYSDFEIEDDV